MLDKILAKLKEIGAFLVIGIVAYLGFEYKQNKDKKDELEDENAKLKADNAVAKQEEKLDGFKNETKKAQTDFDSNNAEFKSGVDELERIRANRPK